MVSVSRDPLPLTLRGTLEYVADLGSGPAFRLLVLDGDGPVPDGTTVTLTVRQQDVVRWDVLAEATPRDVVAVFRHLRDGEEYRTAPITGFVDASSTSWELESLTAAPEGPATPG